MTSKPPWSAPTRRNFLALLGAAVAVVALKHESKAPPAPTVWIGHC